MKEFYERFLVIRLSDYPGLGINSDLNIVIIIAALAALLCITAVVMNIKIQRISEVIKRMLRVDATSPENAKTFAELKFTSERLFRLILNDKESREIIKTVGEKSYSYDEYAALQKQKYDFKKDIDIKEIRFYIPSESLASAEKLIMRRAGILQILLYCVAIFAIAALLVIFLPEILRLIAS